MLPRVTLLKPCAGGMVLPDLLPLNSDETPQNLLQGLILPDPAFPTDPALYLRLYGETNYRTDQAGVGFGPNGLLRGDTYFNLFNIGKWQDRCGLGNLSLRLEGAGVFEVTIWQAEADNRRHRCVVKSISLAGHADISIPVTAGVTAVVYYEIRARGAGHLSALNWVTSQPRLRDPHLILSITTFQREEAIARTAARFQTFIQDSPLASNIDMVIVDNGGTAEIAQSDKLRVIVNENLGGSGGFARGLIEARARGASHCLFMDDDAAIHMASLERTWMFLAYASDPATAVVGAISSGNNPAILWENGAVFASQCRPQYNGTDLRYAAAVVEMELETTAPPPAQYYGGWWFFAFPVDHAEHMPFPFFVRGDDISFSLVNPFRPVTLSGVMCFQDMDFSERESLMTLYLDLRSHLAHHLSLPKLDIGRWRTARIAAWFFARSLYPCHYETLAALNLAIEDAMRGPTFFAQNADMKTRRQQIGAMRDVEKWRDVSTVEPKPSFEADRLWFDPEIGAVRLLMKLSLNGHLLPFFSLYGNRITLPAQDRGAVHKILGAARITYWDTARAQTYTVKHDKLRGARQSVRMLANICRLLLRYRRLKSDWTQGYEALTKSHFWSERLGL